MLVAVLTVVRIAVYPKLKNTPPNLRIGAYPLIRYVNEFLDAVVYAAVFVFMIIRPFAIQAFLIPSGSMWPTLYVNDFIVANKAIYRYSDPKEGDIVVFRPPVEAQLHASDIDTDGTMKLDFIKRCIGVPGDLVEIKKGVLYRNGQKVDETYVHESKCTDEPITDNCVNFVDLNEEEKSSLVPASFKFVRYHGMLMPLNYTDSDANAADPGPRSFSGVPPYSVAQKFQLSDPDEMKKAEALPAEKIPAGYYLMLGDNRNNSYDGRAWGLVPRGSIIGRSEIIWLPLPRWRITR
jgi:signal peptidase I